MSEPKVKVPGHKIFELDDGVIFSSNFDNGNLAGVEKGNRNGEYLLWTAPDNYGSTYQSGHCAWFHFVVSGLQQGTVLKLRIMNASNHGGLYKHDIRPVWKSMSGNKKWSRLRLPVKFSKVDGGAHLYFEHTIDLADDKIYFAFTYPYTYTMVQDDLADLESKTYDIMRPDDIFTQREIVTTSADGLNVDLVTIMCVRIRNCNRRPPVSKTGLKEMCIPCSLCIELVCDEIQERYGAAGLATTLVG